jgi:PAS domain S-box-containing protein
LRSFVPALPSGAASRETGALLRSTDWSRTPLGPPEQWPQSLKLAVSLCQNSRFPMFVWWGEQLINIYNDAYVPMLGKRHPRAFGRPARDSWEDIWDIVGAQADLVMHKGEATWNERVLLVMERHGYPEETWFTWSYSPIIDDTGGIGGLFCAVKEETPTILAERTRDQLFRQVESERARLAEAFEQSPSFVAVLRGPEHVFEFANDRYYRLIGKRDIVGKPARQALPELATQSFFELLDGVYATGEPYVGTNTMVHVRRHPQDDLDTLYLDYVYQPLRRPDGVVDGILVHGVDVTANAHVERTLRESEGRFRQLADAMPQIVFAAQPDGEIDYFNRQWYEYTGLPEGSSGIDSWQSVHTEDGLRRVMEAWPRALGTGQPYEIEYPLRRHDGVYRWHLGRARPIKDEQGRIVRWYGTNTDIHVIKEVEESRQRVEAALASDKKVLELIATGSPLPEVLERIARDAEAQSSDGMLCSILVLDETGQRMRHGAAPSLPPAYNQALDGLPIGPTAGSCGTAAFQRRPVFVSDIAQDPLWEPYRELALAHGLLACHSTPIFNGEGSVLGTVALYYREPRQPSPRDNDIIRSATHLAGIVLEKDRVDRRLHQSLEAEQAARGEAERASRMKDEFLATLSHELRTPLNAILGWTRIIRLKSDLPADLVQGVDVIERNARAQATIIQDLLDMSAIVSGKVRLNMQPMDLETVAQAAVDTVTPAAEAKQIQLACVVQTPGDTLVAGDSSRLQQVLWNLLSNAVKFTPREGRVDVNVRRDASSVELHVTDSGAGIAPEFLPHVFDRFRQGDASTTRRHGGLGLGLSIVKQLVELHGGTVRAASPGVNRGSTFTVSLPVAALRPETGSEAQRAQAAPPQPADGAAPEYAEVAGVRVLVVDDDLDSREMVRRLLEDRRAQVWTAGSAQEALKALLERRFDVLISDIGMPGEDGHALMQRVRALDPAAGGDVPALALTAYARPEDRAHALRSGFQLHAVKPVEPAALFALVAGLAARRG